MRFTETSPSKNSHFTKSCFLPTVLETLVTFSGGKVIDNSTGVKCCGSELNGSPYHPRFAFSKLQNKWKSFDCAKVRREKAQTFNCFFRYETCCQWWTGHGKGHRKSSMRGSVGCCGAEKVRWGANSCCYGYPDPPQVFNHNRDLCCNAHRVSFAVRENNCWVKFIVWSSKHRIAYKAIIPLLHEKCDAYIFRCENFDQNRWEIIWIFMFFNVMKLPTNLLRYKKQKHQNQWFKQFDNESSCSLKRRILYRFALYVLLRLQMVSKINSILKLYCFFMKRSILTITTDLHKNESVCIKSIV